MPCNGSADIGKACSLADRRTMSSAGDKDRNLLARVISAAPGGITAMVGGDDHEIVGGELVQQVRKARIEGFEGGSISGDVAAVSIDGVEVDKIGEQQPAIAQLRKALQRAIEQRIIIAPPLVVSGSAVSKDIVDLADRNHVASVGGGEVEDGGFRRRDREVAAVRGPLEILRRRSRERAGDDAADVERIDQPARDLADREQPCKPERLLMGCDLEHAVGGGVADRLARLDVGGAEARNDLRARGVATAENARQISLRAERISQLAGKAGHGLWEIAPVEGDRNARDLPMA